MKCKLQESSLANLKKHCESVQSIIQERQNEILSIEKSASTLHQQ